MTRIEDLVPLRDEMTVWRRRLHQNPETAFEEFATAQLVVEQLTSFGLEVHAGLAGTGVVGVLRAGGAATAIGLRADMDALPIAEANEIPHRSTVPGKMHACGHDGHTAMLLGAAKHLAATRNFDGTAYFIFQPAEESEGGGRRMVQEGLFKRFSMRAVYGLHNIPAMPIGQFAALPGPMMASFDVFEIQLRGRGTHAAFPHSGADALLAAGQLMVALHTIVSRAIDAQESAVLSITQLHAGDTWNVIPELVVLRGTVRAFSKAVQDTVERRIREIANHIAAAHETAAAVRYERRYPATVNHPRETAEVNAVLRETFGESNVIQTPRPLMGAEDFAFMLQELPGCYVWMGGGGGASAPGLHSPHYDFNDDGLIYGATFWCRLVEALLPSVAEVTGPQAEGVRTTMGRGQYA